MPGPEKGRKMSRARAWFEIKRYFDADARRFAHKEVYARELRLDSIRCWELLCGQFGRAKRKAKSLGASPQV